MKEDDEVTADTTEMSPEELEEQGFFGTKSDPLPNEAHTLGGPEKLAEEAEAKAEDDAPAAKRPVPNAPSSKKG